MQAPDFYSLTQEMERVELALTEAREVVAALEADRKRCVTNLACAMRSRSWSSSVLAEVAIPVPNEVAK